MSGSDSSYAFVISLYVTIEIFIIVKLSKF